MTKKKLKVTQFQLAIRNLGGGERVMKAIAKTMQAKILTTVKKIEGKEIEEIGDAIIKEISTIRTVKV